MLGDLNGKTVLDYGCGAGTVAVLATQSNAQVIAVDIEKGAIAAAELHAAQKGVQDKYFLGNRKLSPVKSRLAGMFMPS